MFLIGAYAKYNYPYVWVSVPRRCFKDFLLVRLTLGPLQLRSQTCGKSLEEIDAPLDLPSTRDWRTKGEHGTITEHRDQLPSSTDVDAHQLFFYHMELCLQLLLVSHEQE